MNPPPHYFYGKHYIASFRQYRETTNEKIKEIFQNALLRFGAIIMNYQEHVFDNGAITFAFLLSESHCTIHTYPEYQSAFIDCFTCGNSFDIENFHNSLLEELQPDSFTWNISIRN